MNNRSSFFIKQSVKLSLSLLIYLGLLLDFRTAKPSPKNSSLLLHPETTLPNDQTRITTQQLVNENVKFLQQQTIPSQLEAIKYLEETRLKWRTLEDQSQEALTLLELGSIYLKIGATTLALERYNEALSLYQELENRLQEAFTLSQIGSVYIAELERLKKEQYLQSIHNLFVNSYQFELWSKQITSTPEKARDFYNQSLAIYQELNNLSGEASILNAMAQSQYLHDREDKQILLEKSLAIYQEIGDKKGEALVLGHLSQLNLIEYRNDQAGWDLFNQAIAIYREIAKSSSDAHFTTRQAEADLLKIAVQYWWGKNQEKAFEFHNQFLKIYQEIGDKQGEALALRSMGDNYAWLEDRQKQLEFYTQALNIYQEIGDRIEEANTLDYIGATYSLLGDLEKALESYNQELKTLKEASQIYTQIGDTDTALIFEYRQPIVWFAIGKLYSQLEDDTNEVEAYNQARRIYQKWQDDEGETDFLLKIAEHYGKQQNSQRTIEFLNHAVRVYQEIGNLQAEANLLREKIAGIYFYTLKDSEQGFATLNQSLEIYQEIGDPKEVANTLNRIGYFYLYAAENEQEQKLENQQKALEFYRKAVVAYQEIKNFSEQAYTLYEIGKIYYELGNKQKAVEAFNQAGNIFQENGDSERAVSILLRIGEDYTKFGEKETALIFYDQAIPISQELGDYKQEARILRTMGQLYYELENLDKVVETFNQARKVYQNNRDRSGEAWTIYEIGKSYTILGDLKTALDSYYQALSIYEQEPNAPFREERTLDIFIRMSRIYAYLGESEKSVEYCKKSLAYAQEMLQSKMIRNLENYREIGKLCYQIGEAKTALESFEQYGKVYQQFGRDDQVLGLMRIGEDYTELGDSKQALDFFNQAKKVYQESSFSEGEIDTLIWIARIYDRTGNHQQALDYLNQGLIISQEIDNRSKEALILLEIGENYFKSGDQEKALAFYNQAQKIYQELGDYRNQKEIINKIGVLYQQFGDLEKALEFYHQSLTVFQEDISLDSVFVFINIAKIYSELGDLDKALEFLKQAINLNKQPNFSLYTEIGKVYSSLGELEKALEFFNKSLELQRNNYPEARADNLLGIAIIERNKGNIPTALTQIKTAISLIEETRTGKVSTEERLAFFASKQDYYEFYIDLLMELHQQNPSQGYDAEALNISERSKARNLLELLAEANTDIRKGVDPELVIQERSLQQQLDAVERRRIEVYKNNDSTLEQKTAIEQEQKYLLDKYEKVQTQIREKSPSYAALTQPQPLNLEQIQQQIIDNETLLLQYTLGEKRSFLWAVTKDSMTSYELPSKALIEQAVKAFFRSSVINQSPSSENLSSASQNLYQMILGPVTAQLNHQRLAIVSDGILHYLPFSALSLPSSSENDYLPLIINHEIVNLPSASILSILRRHLQHRKPAPKTIAIVADPVFSAEDNRLKTPTLTRGESWEQYTLNRSAQQLDIGVWNRLPGTRTEAEAILALVPESESTYAFDFAANRATATHIQLSQYKIIHFATHGLLNSINPELSGIILSMVDEQGNSLNGFLRLHDIFNLNFSADLVVLSACKTGLGKQVRGEGLVGLTQGFMYAGTPRVLVSLWDVDDAGTAEIMTRFYRFLLKEKLSATEALRRAQLEMQTDTQWKSPYYWAAFTLQGEWNSSEKMID